MTIGLYFNPLYTIHETENLPMSAVDFEYFKIHIGRFQDSQSRLNIYTRQEIFLALN